MRSSRAAVRQSAPLVVGTTRERRRSNAFRSRVASVGFSRLGAPRSSSSAWRSQIANSAPGDFVFASCAAFVLWFASIGVAFFAGAAAAAPHETPSNFDSSAAKRQRDESPPNPWQQPALAVAGLSVVLSGTLFGVARSNVRPSTSIDALQATAAICPLIVVSLSNESLLLPFLLAVAATFASAAYVYGALRKQATSTSS